MSASNAGPARALFLVKHGPASHAFEMREIPEPKAGPHEVVIDVEASGLNFADVLARQGSYPDCPPLPAVIGYEVVGRVRELGSDAVREGRLQKGMRVVAFCRFGGYASRRATLALATSEIPESMDAATATALATQGGTAYVAAEELVRIRKGDLVLVQAAAGGVGSLLVQLAKRRGAVVFGTAGSQAKIDLLKQHGVDYPINYRTREFDDAIREILGSRGEKGIDIVFDSLGGSHVKRAMRLLRAPGRMVCFGAANIAGESRNPLRVVKTLAGFGFLHYLPLMTSSRSVIGLNMLRVADERPEMVGRALHEIVELVKKGELKPWPGKAYPVSKIAEAHEFLASRESAGKVALLW